MVLHSEQWAPAVPSFVAVSTSPSMRRSRPKNIKGPSMISFDSHTTILGQTKRWTHELPAIRFQVYESDKFVLWS